ncbi:MAG TPA: hypothetical protein VFM14_03255 [Gemmatimonadales bacterium]|nr:hypothetical protein [Gemmatimonadales bacterium]
MVTESFELRIRVMGLCLFRPAVSDNEKRCMEVLMVKPKHHEKHVARVWYDKAYESSSPTQLSGSKNRKDLPGKIDWSALKVMGGSVKKFGSELPDLSDVIGDESANPVPGSNVNTVLQLPPGEADFELSGPDWEWEGTQYRLANVVIWIVNVNEESLPGKGDLPTLHPVAEKMELFMSNVIEAHSTYPPPEGTEPKKNTPMPHFDALYELYERYKGERRSPIYQPRSMSTTYSCLPSQGK